MSVQLTIRDVPEQVRDELAARAALQRKSMQEFLRCELERIASRPSLDVWLKTVRDRKDAAGTRLGAAAILRARDADRVWELRGNLTSYDAWYVAVAEAYECPLATLDLKLSRATGPACRFRVPQFS